LTGVDPIGSNRGLTVKTMASIVSGSTVSDAKEGYASPSINTAVESEANRIEPEDSPSGVVGESVLTQAIEELSVEEKVADSAGVLTPKDSRAFSPSTMNSLPPISSAGGVSGLNLRTCSPAQSASPTAGILGGVGGLTSSSSPSTSQVSVGSVGPTLVAALLNQRHHYALTPVMRNTAMHEVEASYATGKGRAVPGASSAHGVVSPDTVEEENGEFLHGEHLSLPADLSSTADEDGPILPLRKVAGIPTFPTMQRAKSLGTVAHALLSQETEKVAAVATLETSGLPPPAPVDFPGRKFYSFTSREQYQRHGVGGHVPEDDELSEESLGERPDLAPYMPSRQEFEDVEESAPPEVLDSIFIARRRRSSIARENPQVVVREEDEDGSHKNHRMLQVPIAMTDRQWSIPSLHQANRLATDGSLASLTDHPDEDSLLFVTPSGGNEYVTDEDEASLSSRASSLYMSIGGSGGFGVPTFVPTTITSGRIQDVHEPRFISLDPPHASSDEVPSFSFHPSVASSSFGESSAPSAFAPSENTKVVVESPWNLLSGTQSSLSDENSAIAVDGDRAMRRKRKQRQREEAALSWIQSLQQQSEPAVAEAASSKFLTGRSLEGGAPHSFAHHKGADEPSAFAAITEESPPQRR
jgi:hypothetical protein